MKIIKRNILILTIIKLVTLLHGCECVSKPNCNGDFNFKIIDGITRKDLVQGPDAKYTLDSIKVLPTRDSIPPSFVYALQNFLICSLNGLADTIIFTAKCLRYGYIASFLSKY